MQPKKLSHPLLRVLTQIGFLGILSGFFIYACTNAPPTPSQKPPTQTAKAPSYLPTSKAAADSSKQTPPVLAKTSLPPTPTTIPPPGNHPRHTLAVILDYEQKTAAVHHIIAFRNLTSDSLSELLLVVEPNWTLGAFVLKSAAWDKVPIPENSWSLSNNILKIPFETPVQPGDAQILVLDYLLTIPAQATVFGYTDRQINLGNWYPFIPEYQPNTGWLAYARNNVGEHSVYAVADYNVSLTIQNGPTDLVIAASAPATQQEGVYNYTQLSARNFSLSLSPYYHINEKQVGDITIISYAFPENQLGSEGAAQITAEALQLFQELFGPYPHKSLSIVAAGFPDGLEFDGLYFLSQDFYLGYRQNYQNWLTLITVHETAHMWWGGLVGNDQAVEPWLDEALATYSEMIYYQYKHPDLLPWWWEFRIHQYQPYESGNVNDSIFQYGSFRPYVNAIYLRGALFLDEIRIAMGDPAFMAGLKDYALQNRHQTSDSQMFLDTMAARKEINLEYLKSRYFNP